jgi:hypothetical protein
MEILRVAGSRLPQSCRFLSQYQAATIKLTAQASKYDIRFWHLLDFARCPFFDGYRGESGHDSTAPTHRDWSLASQFKAQSGHSAMSGLSPFSEG